MPRRYFKATDGQFTIFRASETKVYRGAWMRLDRVREKNANGIWGPVGKPLPMGFGFAAKSGGASGGLKAYEIGKHEYEVLVLIKTKRIDAWREERKEAGQTHFGSVTPSDSWVRNDELPEGLYVGPTP